MANFTGYTPQAVPRFGSVVQWDDPTQLPLGLAKIGRNIRYTSQSAGTRYGLKHLLTFGGPIAGFGALRYVSPNSSGQSNISIIAATQNDGNIWAVQPFTQSTLTQLNTASFEQQANIAPQSGLFAQCVQAYNRMYIAQSDLIMGVAPVLQVDGATQNLDPVSDLPFGATWQPNLNVRVGHIVTATNQKGPATGILFRCITAGKTAAVEPIWPTTEGQTVGDGTATWEVINILVSSGLTPPPAPLLQGTTTDSGSVIVNGATIFLACTWTNQYGESTALIAKPDGTLGNVLQYKNSTGGPVDVNVVLPAVPPELAVLAGQYSVTGCKLYAYITTDATPDPTKYTDPTYYALLGSYAPTQSVAVKAYPVGPVPPTTNTAFTTDSGNVSSGTRYMIVLYKTRTGYITGVSDAVPIRCDISLDGRKMLVQNIPIGPYNCVARICAFTVAGQSSAGPYFYIPQDDYVDPGEGEAKILQTATMIADNETTSAYFDFIDSYLEGAEEVTDYFDRIQVPPASDVYFSKGLNRVVYTGCQGYDHLVSDLTDPEAVRVPGSNLTVATNDGDRCVCWREMRGVQLSLKENSGHAITPNDGDPNTWAVDKLWDGVGPCGPRAVDVYNADLSEDQAGQPFMVIAHRTGGYLYTSGAPTLITRELKQTWETINWKYATQIKVCIDPLHREIRFHVPTGTSTVNNLTLTLNYYFGFGEPVVFAIRSARLVPNPEGRKWSLDDISANDAMYLPQRYQYTAPVEAPQAMRPQIERMSVNLKPQYISPDGGDGGTPPPPPPPNPLVIYTTSLPSASIGVPYQQNIVAGGGTLPYTYSIVAGALPAGLTLNAASGIISGTPTASGNFSFTVGVTDSSSPIKTAYATLSIAVPSQPYITTSSLPSAVVGVAYFADLSAAGGAAPYGFQLVSGGLPAGLTLAATGGITGTPTASGNFSFTVQVYDSNSPQGTNTANFSISVAAQGVANPVVAMDMTVLIAGIDGGIYCIQANQFHDDDAQGNPHGYMSQWQSVPGTNPRLAIMQLGGATVSAKGAGQFNIQALDLAGNSYSLTTIQRPFIFNTDGNGNAIETIRDFPARAIPRSEHYGISFDNGAQADSWFEVHVATLYVRPFFAARRA